MCDCNSEVYTCGWESQEYRDDDTRAENRLPPVLLLGTLIQFYQSKCLVVPEAALPVGHSISYLSNLPA